MKKIAILVGMLILLATVAVIWAQNQPDNAHPQGGFLGNIAYKGCEGSASDQVCIRPDGGDCYYYSVIFPFPHYSTDSPNPPPPPKTLPAGWYSLSVVLGQYSQCNRLYVPVRRVYHGEDWQIVDLEVGPEY